MTVPKDLTDYTGLNRLDPVVISAVYDECYPLVFRYIRYRLGDDPRVEDICSEVFMKMLEAINRRKGPKTNLKAWLLSTASNLVNDEFRKTYRHPQEDLREEIPDDLTPPSLTAEIRESRRSLRAALRELTPEQQHVIALRFGEELSLEDTSAVMGKNINTVKQLQFRALAALGRLIGETS